VLAHRLWQAGAGAVTLILVVRFLSAEEQGWYYSFLSVAALWSLFELGLSVVLVQAAARFWRDSNWSVQGAVVGGHSARFLSLLVHSVRWYGVLAWIVLLVLLPGGVLFFGEKDGSALHWMAPWVVLCLFTALALVLIPYLAVIEGSGQVAVVYRVRLLQGILGSVLCWSVLAFGGGLWASGMAPAAAVLVPAAWLMVTRRQFVEGWWRHKASDFDWRSEIWPLQWRLGVSQLCGYLLTQINIPLLFQVQSPIEAGQMGVSLTLVNMIGLFAGAWIARQTPEMVRLVLERNWPAVDRVFFRDLTVSSAVYALGAASILGVLLAIEDTKFGGRILPFWQFVGLLLMSFSSHIVGAMANQLRCFRREPLVVVMVVSTLLIVPTNWWMAAHYSSAGIVATLVIVMVGFNLPVAIAIWRRCNRLWRV